MFDLTPGVEMYKKLIVLFLFSILNVNVRASASTGDDVVQLISRMGGARTADSDDTSTTPVMTGIDKTIDASLANNTLILKITTWHWKNTKLSGQLCFNSAVDTVTVTLDVRDIGQSTVNNKTDVTIQLAGQKALIRVDESQVPGNCTSSISTVYSPTRSSAWYFLIPMNNADSAEDLNRKINAVWAPAK